MRQNYFELNRSRLMVYWASRRGTERAATFGVTLNAGWFFDICSYNFKRGVQFGLRLFGRTVADVDWTHRVEVYGR